MKKFSLKNKLENEYSSVIHVAKWLDFVPFHLQLKKKKKKKGQGEQLRLLLKTFVLDLVKSHMLKFWPLGYQNHQWAPIQSILRGKKLYFHKTPR